MRNSLFTIFIIFFFLSTSKNINAQFQTIKPHGTLIVPLICDDGIIFCSDTRASITTEAVFTQLVYTYHDNAKKIFPIGNFSIAITGFGSIKGIYWETLLDNFNKKHKQDSTLHGTFAQLKKFLNKKYKIPDSLIYQNRFYLAGYERNIPIVIQIDSTGESSINRPGHRFYSNPMFRDFFISLKIDPRSSDNIADSLEKKYIEFSKVDPSVSGSVYILKIKKDNSVEVLKTQNFKKFKTELEFLKAIQKNEIEMKYLFPRSKEVLYRNIKFQIKHYKLLKDY